MSPLEMLKFVQGSGRSEAEQLKMLAAMGDAPEEEDQIPLKLPVQNDIPAFKIGDGSVGSQLLGQDYGVPAPVFGEHDQSQPSIGQMLVGDYDANGNG